MEEKKESKQINILNQKLIYEGKYLLFKVYDFETKEGKKGVVILYNI